jgi:multimeric flavodoxin WrbA
MTIKLLSLSGSPVRDSSIDILLQEVALAIAQELPDDYEIEYTFVRLNERQIMPCQACGMAPQPDFCFYEDDMTPLYEKLAECDCLLVGSPIHFDTVSSQLKLFIDRCNCVRPADFDNVDPEHDFLKILPRKRPGAMVLVGGENGWFEGARRCIAGFFKWVEVVNEGLVEYRSPDFHKYGLVRDKLEKLAEARELGRKLADKL